MVVILQAFKEDNWPVLALRHTIFFHHANKQNKRLPVFKNRKQSVSSEVAKPWSRRNTSTVSADPVRPETPFPLPAVSLDACYHNSPITQRKARHPCSHACHAAPPHLAGMPINRGGDRKVRRHRIFQQGRQHRRCAERLRPQRKEILPSLKDNSSSTRRTPKSTAQRAGAKSISAELAKAMRSMSCPKSAGNGASAAASSAPVRARTSPLEENRGK